MFKKTLEEIVEKTEGCLGALIMGVDGIAVEQVLPHAGQEANLDVAAAELTSIIRNTQIAGRHIGLGVANEIVIAFESMNVVMRFLSGDYFLLLAMSPESVLGRGRFALRRAELVLAKEFQI